MIGDEGLPRQKENSAVAEAHGQIQRMPLLAALDARQAASAGLLE